MVKRKMIDEESNSMEADSKILPSQLLRKWKKAGRILNVANALGKLQSKDRKVYFDILEGSRHYKYNCFRVYSDPEVDMIATKDKKGESGMYEDAVDDSDDENFDDSELDTRSLLSL